MAVFYLNVRWGQDLHSDPEAYDFSPPRPRATRRSAARHLLATTGFQVHDKHRDRGCDGASVSVVWIRRGAELCITHACGAGTML